MNKENQKSTGSLIGASSLLVIFAILCMTAFSLLGLSTASAHKRLTDIQSQAFADYYAADFLHFVQSKGIAVPKEMSIAGFDDSSLSRQLHPSLTTIGQNHTARAKLAVERLRMLRKSSAVEPEILLPVKLIPRDSTGPVG